MSGDVQIRRAVAADAQAIATILREAFSEFVSDYTPQAFAVITPPAEEIAGRFEEGPVWVASKDGKPVGTVSALPEPEWLYIRSMAVLPNVQGRGIARMLMRAVENYGIENGFDTLFLYTTHFSKDAVNLYEKLGYRKGRNTTAEEWFGTPGFSMSKKLGRNTKQNVVGS